MNQAGWGAPKPTQRADAEAGAQSWPSGDLLGGGHACVTVPWEGSTMEGKGLSATHS